MKNKVYCVILVSFIFIFSGTISSFAEKVYTVKLNRYQLQVDENNPKEAEALLLSEGGSGGIIVTPAEKPHWGNIISLYAEEMKELPILDGLKSASVPSGIRVHLVFDHNVYSLPGDAWIKLNVFQIGATSICPYSKNSFRCG